MYDWVTNCSIYPLDYRIDLTAMPIFFLVVSFGLSFGVGFRPYMLRNYYARSVLMFLLYSEYCFDMIVIKRDPGR
jgi:hypothetical protein